MARRYRVSRTVDAPPETVWRLLTDAGGYADWNPTVVSVTGAIEQGERIELVTTASPKRVFRLTVAALEAPHRMVWTDGLPLGLFTGTRTYLLEPEGTATSFSMTEEFTGPLAPLITRAIPDLTDSFEQFADGLRTAAEGRTREGGG